MGKKLTDILNRGKLNVTVQQMLAAASEDEQELIIDGDEQEIQNEEGQAVELPEAPPVVVPQLFVNTKDVKSNTGNQLSATAQLTNIAEDITEEIFDMMMSSQSEYADDILASQQSHDSMDDLILSINELDTIDIDFLKALDENTLEKMIRSQQSKRSRAKAKEMTADNYKVMMTGAVAELLLRIAADKPKSASTNSDVAYSDKELEKLASDEEALKKAIRNVQSKKSIAKSKADFSETSQRWQALLIAEKQLKDLRNQLNGLVNEQANEALQLKKQQEELLADFDPENASAEDAKELLAMMKQMLAGK